MFTIKPWDIKADDSWLSPTKCNAHLIANVDNMPRCSECGKRAHWKCEECKTKLCDECNTEHRESEKHITDSVN